MTRHGRLQAFLDFSAELTGFTAFELQGSGQAEAYLKTCDDVVGDDAVDELLEAYGHVRSQAGQDGVAAERLMRREILSDEKLGAVARNIIKLWYVGTWYELPPAWSERFGAREKNFTFMVSPTAYTEGLLWPTIGANPAGAKAPGYGSWARPPRIPQIAGTSTGSSNL